jgi:hypothetical protein
VHASAPTLTRAPEKNSEPLTGPAAPASSDLSFGGAANRRKIAVGELERIAFLKDEQIRADLAPSPTGRARWNPPPTRRKQPQFFVLPAPRP